MKKIFGVEKGITIIALVITIIVLLIISGITIGALSGDNGLINQSYENTQNAQKESFIEKVEADLYSEKTITGKMPNENTLIEILKKYGTVDNENKTVKPFDIENSILFSEIAGWNGGASEHADVNANEFNLDSVLFDGTNYIDTGISLFNEENVRKDFEISFEVIHVGSIGNDETLLYDFNNESDKDGIYIRTADGYYSMLTKCKDTNKKYGDICCASQKDEQNITRFVKYKIDIKRINNQIIYTIDEGEENLRISFANLIEPFDETLKFGAILDSNGNPYNFFKGEVTNIKVKLADEPNYREIRTSDSYKLEGDAIFNGEGYIDTNLKLFSSENVNRNFEIDLDIADFNGNKDQATIINSMDESGTPWPGFVVRFSGTSSLSFKANATTTNRQEKKYTASNIGKINIKRIGGKLYYSTNNIEESLLINYSDLNKQFNTPLTFGSSLKGNGEQQRQFKGKISNIYARFTD